MREVVPRAALGVLVFGAVEGEVDLEGVEGSEVGEGDVDVDGVVGGLPGGEGDDGDLLSGEASVASELELERARFVLQERELGREALVGESAEHADLADALLSIDRERGEAVAEVAGRVGGAGAEHGADPPGRLIEARDHEVNVGEPVITIGGGEELQLDEPTSAGVFERELIAEPAEEVVNVAR